MDQIEQYLKMACDKVGQELDRQLPAEQGDAARLAQAMRYSVFNGGKRLRPALFFAALEVLGGDRDTCLPFAAAVEMIHCYSLIHDDLPAMDDDAMRRGKPACHKAFDEATAILAGDGLLTLASGIVSMPLPGIDPACQQAAAAAVMVGALSMVQGQAAEMNAASPDTEMLMRIYHGKTSGLFLSALLSAAHLAGADKEQLDALTIYGSKLGLAFQIADDILDIRGEQETTGRPAGSDERNSKQTAAALLGCEEAELLASRLAAEAEAVLDVLPFGGGVLRLFPSFLVGRALAAMGKK